MTTAPASTGLPDRTRVQPVRTPRWGSLDVLRGFALWAMIAHHLFRWTGGEVTGRLIGFDHFVVTDLTAPGFGVAVGASAAVVGARIDSIRGALGPLRRWGEVLLVGLAIDVAVDGRIDGGGVLLTLAVLGCAVMVMSALGLRQPLGWFALAVGSTFVVQRAVELPDDSFWLRFLNGAFSLPVYGVFAGVGAGIAVAALGRDEGALPIGRTMIGAVVVGLVLHSSAGGVVSPTGLWPPDRHPGYLDYTFWGLLATLAVWLVARRWLPVTGWIGAAASRAGHRTLSVFAAHYVVKVVIKDAGYYGRLTGDRWSAAAWVATIAACVLTGLPTGPTELVRRLRSRGGASGGTPEVPGSHPAPR